MIKNKASSAGNMQKTQISYVLYIKLYVIH